MGSAWIIAKKMFSLTLVFNALLTIACAINVLSIAYFYSSGWKPFEYYLIDVGVFWFAIVAAILNLYPSTMLGRKLHTGRFFFHHYFYGFLVMVVAAVYIVFFTPASLFTIFLVFNESVNVNIGKFFLLAGFALLLDDLPDVSTRVERSLNLVKDKVRQIPRFIEVVQAIAGVGSLYLGLSIFWGIINVPAWVILANFITCFSILITAVTSFTFTRRRFWHNIELSSPKDSHSRIKTGQTKFCNNPLKSQRDIDAGNVVSIQCQITESVLTEGSINASCQKAQYQRLQFDIVQN
jgi:hypothetical protein